LEGNYLVVCEVHAVFRRQFTLLPCYIPVQLSLHTSAKECLLTAMKGHFADKT